MQSIALFCMSYTNISGAYARAFDVLRSSPAVMQVSVSFQYHMMLSHTTKHIRETLSGVLQIYARCRSPCIVIVYIIGEVECQGNLNR